MDSKILNCEDEQIHLCGKVQNFGYLIVFNFELKCIAISENCESWLKNDISTFFNQDINFFIQLLERDNEIKININDFTSLQNKSFTYKVKLNEKNYQLTVYNNNNQIFFEFEKNNKTEFELNQITNFQVEFEQSDNIWQTLCDNIYNIIGFDRIMVYQFSEDKSGIVIAENIREELDSLLGYRYPEFDIPAQARQLYLKNLSRQTPNIHADTFEILSQSSDAIDLSRSQIRATSPVHLQYLENFGVKASASFSIVIDNQLWGLVACQNLTPKYIPYDLRSLCLFITQYVASKHVVNTQRIDLEQSNIIKEIELELKEKLFYSQSLEQTLEQFGERFMHALSAKGLIIKSPDYTIRFGNTLTNKTLAKIHSLVNENSNDENIFTTHSFSIDTDLNDDIIPTGLARMSFDKDSTFSIYWFRDEIKIEEKWAGVPEKHPIYSEEKQAHIYSPRISFELWKKEVLGQSEKWSRFDLAFLTRIHKLIQNSISRKLNEIKLLNEKLIEINNKLEAYTHQISHDLKNPLTNIKASAQIIQKKHDLNREMIMKFSSNILESATLINDIIDKTIELSKDSSNILSFNQIPIESFMNDLINQAVETYHVNNLQLKIGNLHPILGDKTLLYQLFMNLINNAIKFSSKQELTNLEVYSVQEGDKTVYYIKDNGIGIEEAEKSNIFNIFKRLSNADHFEGTGVGMSIVKRITDKLNAQITFDSTVGVGTTFKISFPNE